MENAEPQEARRHLKLSEDGRTVSLEQDIKGGVFVCARAELVRGCARATVTVPKETATGDLDIGCVSADGTRAWLYLGRAGERVEQRRAQSQWVDASERVQCGAPLLPEDRVAMELDLLPAQPRLIFTLNGRALPGAAAPPRGCAARFAVRLHVQGERAELTHLNTDSVPSLRVATVPPPPPPPPLVLSGHAASLTPYQSDTPRPSPRTTVPPHAAVQRSSPLAPWRSAPLHARAAPPVHPQAGRPVTLLGGREQLGAPRCSFNVHQQAVGNKVWPLTAAARPHPRCQRQAPL